MKVLLVSLALSLSHTHIFASFDFLNLKSYTIIDVNTQGPDPSLVYRPNVDTEAKEKEEYRNFDVSLVTLSPQKANFRKWKAELVFGVLLELLHQQREKKKKKKKTWNMGEWQRIRHRVRACFVKDFRSL